MSRRTNATGQLLPINERLNAHQQEKREVKIWARRTIAEKLAMQQQLQGMTVMSFFTMTFIQKMLWVFLGRLPNIRLQQRKEA